MVAYPEANQNQNPEGSRIQVVCRTRPRLRDCKENVTAQWRLPTKIFGQTNRKSLLRSGILFASSEIIRRPGSDSPLHSDIRRRLYYHQMTMFCPKALEALASNTQLVIETKAKRTGPVKK